MKRWLLFIGIMLAVVLFIGTSIAAVQIDWMSEDVPVFCALAAAIAVGVIVVGAMVADMIWDLS